MRDLKNEGQGQEGEKPDLRHSTANVRIYICKMSANIRLRKNGPTHCPLLHNVSNHVRYINSAFSMHVQSRIVQPPMGLTSSRSLQSVLTMRQRSALAQGGTIGWFYHANIHSEIVQWGAFSDNRHRDQQLLQQVFSVCDDWPGYSIAEKNRIATS